MHRINLVILMVTKLTSVLLIVLDMLISMSLCKKHRHAK